MYNPYSNVGETHQVNTHHQQPQQPQFQTHEYPTGPAPGATPMGGGSVPGFNGVFNDPRAAMGLQFSQTALNAGQQYVQNNFGSMIHSQNIKYYFKVSNSYVLKKLSLVLFPYRNKTWARLSQTTTDQNNNAIEVFAAPREDVNAPDLYIPVMGYVTYILLWAMFSGMKGSFHPEQLGFAASKVLGFQFADVACLNIAMYVLAVESKFWDTMAYSGYKFVSVLVMMLFRNMFPGWTYLYYVFSISVLFSLGFFLMRSLRYVMLPSTLSTTLSPNQRKMRTNFLFLYSFPIQLCLIYFML